MNAYIFVLIFFVAFAFYYLSVCTAHFSMVFVQDLTKAVYPDLQACQLHKKYLSSHTILTPKNDRVDQINADL